MNNYLTGLIFIKYLCLPENKSRGKNIGPIRPTVESMFGVIIAKKEPKIQNRF